VKGAESGDAENSKKGLEDLLSTAGALLQLNDQINLPMDP
jgi:hypothetical protein